MTRRRVIVACPDSMGDVLVTGPAIRAIAVSAEVVLLCGPRGLEAAEMLPGVSRIVCADLQLIDSESQSSHRLQLLRLRGHLERLHADEAVIFSSAHQDPLPLALLLRLAGVRRISAISEADPGSLLDVRHGEGEDVHAVERALGLVEAAGYARPDGDDASLRITYPGPPPKEVANLRPYVVLHPDVLVRAGIWPAESSRRLVELLRGGGRNVVVTRGPDERKRSSRLAGPRATNLGAKLGLPEIAAVIRDAEVIVVPNTGPAHLAAAVGTPVVSLVSPVTSDARWRPWGVPHALLGDKCAVCGRTCAPTCPVNGLQCLASVSPEDVVGAVQALSTSAHGGMTVLPPLS